MVFFVPSLYCYPTDKLEKASTSHWKYEIQIISFNCSGCNLGEVCFCHLRLSTCTWQVFSNQIGHCACYLSLSCEVAWYASGSMLALWRRYTCNGPADAHPVDGDSSLPHSSLLAPWEWTEPLCLAKYRKGWRRRSWTDIHMFPDRDKLTRRMKVRSRKTTQMSPYFLRCPKRLRRKWKQTWQKELWC